MAEAERYQHYEVLRRADGSLWELGRGTMGITYRAIDTSLHCPVALKVINSSYLGSEVARQRFLREARAAASLRHRNVASVFHLGTDHESYFYAMEFIDGETVDAYVRRKGSLDPAEALGITLQVSRALAAADKENLVHRDLKPANLMLVEEDDEKVVKVIDFGLAKITQRGGESSGTLTFGGGFVGTPHFASPEQLEEKDIDIRSDIYSLGATLYYMLAGRPPYSGAVAQIMSQHLYKPLPMGPLDGFSPCVVELIQRMMEKDPAKRPQRPVDLRQEILSCLERLQADATGGTSVGARANVGALPDTSATVVPVSSPGASAINLPSGKQIPPSQSSIDDAGQPLSATWSTAEKRRSVLRLITVLVLFAVIGLGGYFIYQLFLGAPSEQKGQPINSVANSLAQVSSPPPAQASATPNRAALASSSAASSSATPTLAAIAGPSVEVSATPDRAALASSSAASISATPTQVAIAGPSVEVSATPNREMLESSSAAPGSVTPTQVAIAGPGVEVSATPNREMLASSSAASSSATPTQVAIAGPSAEVSATPNREVLLAPSAESSTAPSNSVAIAGRGAEVGATPNREVLPHPSAEAGVTPNQEASAGPAVEVGSTPNQTAPAAPGVEASAPQSQETPASPSPDATAITRLEPTATPDSRMADSQSRAMRDSSPAENYSEKLAAAQRLIDNSDWPGALRAYLALIEQYPERPAASRNLENLLTEWSTNERKVDTESLAQMKPDLVRAAENGILPAMLIVARSSQETDRAVALKWYEAAALKGSVEGMKKAGELLYSNHKRPDDDLKALNYFVQAASTGDPESEYLSGECYFFGKGATPDIDKAVQFLQQAAAQHYPKAMDLLGTCYRKRGEFEQARRSYEEAAAAGYALSFYNLGVLYMNGEGVLRSPKKAEDQFRRSAELSKEHAEKGDIISMFYYASWLEQGIGVAKDAKAASEWFRRSAQGGYPPALDWCHRNGVAW
jgi:serine/threonine protein kinase/TPR repeat protein